MGSLIRGPGGIGFINFPAQLAVIGIGDNRHVGRVLQGQQPAVLVPVPGCLPGKIQSRIRQARQLARIADQFAPGIGGIKKVFLETCADLRQAAGNLSKPLLLAGRQVHAGETEIPQGVLQQFALRLVQIQRLLLYCLVGLEQRLVLTHFRGVVGKFGQAGVVGIPQFRGIEHGIEMRNRRPCP